MNKYRPFVLATLVAAVSTVVHAADLNVGVTISGQIQPGVYGRVDIGNTPPPLVYAQPMIIAPSRGRHDPIYLNVPPGHARKWAKHCAAYDACGRPVYFVRTSEYEGERGDDRRRNDRGDDREEGRGHGRGHGHGKHD